MTSPRPADRRGLEAVGGLTLTSPDGTDYRLTGRPDGLHLQADSLGDLFALRRQGPGGRQRGELLARAHAVAAHTGLAVRISVADSEVARINPAASGGLLSRLAGLGPTQLSLAGLFRALLRLGRR